MHKLSVRARLALWYCAVTSAGLLLFGLLSLGVLRFALLQVKQASVARREQRLLAFLRQNQADEGNTARQLRNFSTITHEGNLFQLRAPDGSLIFPSASDDADWLRTPDANCLKPVFFRQRFQGDPIIVMCHVMLLKGRIVRLYLGSSLEEDSHILLIYRNALLLLVPCLLGAAAFVGYLLSRHALRPVDHLTRAAVRIGIANLYERLPVPEARDEIRELVLAWNQLLDRLEEAVSRLSQFSTDVSHDLRTSITVMLATAQLALNRHPSADPDREDLDRIVDECRTASTLLDTLLSMARSNTFVHEVTLRRIDLSQLVIASCRRIEDLAEQRGIILDWIVPDDPVYAQADELMLHRLLGILLDNAVKYTPQHGEIRVELSGAPGEAVIAVRDTGIGMSDQVCRQIFNRYYQADLRERKSQSGSGLGLSIARWIAEAHHAELSVESVPARGSVFRIRLPLTSSSISAGVLREIAS